MLNNKNSFLRLGVLRYIQLYSNLKNMSSVRWAFNLSKWEPTEKEFLLASSCIQSDEKERIGRFVFKKDAKASLIGRLLIRKFISETTGVPYDSINISRDHNNKPVYNADNPSSVVSFNVSHHGSFTVLAGEIGDKKVGIDVMKFEYTGGKTLEEFFRIMNRNFSVSEWKKIKGTPQSTNHEKISTFCRNWALKESYVKALGIGITLDLQKISFQINSDLIENKVSLDTDLYINDEKQPWIFEESLLDSLHAVAVALEKDKNSEDSLKNNTFKIMDLDELLKNAVALISQDLEYCKKFFLKD